MHASTASCVKEGMWDCMLPPPRAPQAHAYRLLWPCSLPHPNPKYFLLHTSHQIFRPMHGALNVGKKDNPLFCRHASSYHIVCSTQHLSAQSIYRWYDDEPEPPCMQEEVHAAGTRRRRQSSLYHSAMILAVNYHLQSSQKAGVYIYIYIAGYKIIYYVATLSYDNCYVNLRDYCNSLL
jgi:hypothetical protein